MTSIKQNKIEIISTLQKEDYNIALKFVELGKSLDCPNTIRFANAHKAWKIVYNSSKPKRILYTIECRKNTLKIKACLYNIDSYKDRIQSETIVDILRISHDCNQCNSRHKGGFRFTIKDKEYDKCSGCGFYFKDMTDDEWENVLLMIELENSARENK